MHNNVWDIDLWFSIWTFVLTMPVTGWRNIWPVEVIWKWFLSRLFSQCLSLQSKVWDKLILGNITAAARVEITVQSKRKCKGQKQ